MTNCQWNLQELSERARASMRALPDCGVVGDDLKMYSKRFPADALRPRVISPV